MKIYEPKGRAREYSPLALNYFKGCDHGCAYCYVPGMMTRFNADYKHNKVVAPSSFIELEKSAKKFQGCEKQILLSFTGDPYCNTENGETRQVLEILLKYDHKVAILTKNPEKALKDGDLMLKFGDRIKIGTTLTFSQIADSKKWEPGALAPKKRIAALREFANQGVKTWASFEPVIIPYQSLVLIEYVADFIDHVKVGKLNNYKGIDKEIDWSLFLSNTVEVMRIAKMNDRFYIKKDLQAFNKGVHLSENETNEDYLNL